MSRWIATIRFRLCHRLSVRQWFRMFLLRRAGMRIGANSSVGRVDVSWPNQVAIGMNSHVLDFTVFDFCHGVWCPGTAIEIGDNVYIGRGVDFNCRSQIQIGSDCLIAAGCRLVDHDHGMEIGQPMRLQDGPEAPIVLEQDVWLGANVIVLKGVTIGHGAVVAAGAVVRQSIPPFEIWGGVPARRLGVREKAANA